MTTPHDTHHQAPDGPAARTLGGIFLLIAASFFITFVYQALARFDAQPYSSVAITVLVFVIFGRIFRRFWLGFKTGSCTIELNTYGINFSKDGEDTFIAFADEDAAFTPGLNGKEIFNKTHRFRLPNGHKILRQLERDHPETFPLKCVPSPVFITFLESWGIWIYFAWFWGMPAFI